MELNNAIEESLRGIPTDRILALARSVQAAIASGAQQVKSKDASELVTQADIEIQQLLVDYFAQSPLAGRYLLKTEEACSSQGSTVSASLQVIIDPLDGTTPFARGESLWGTMVGVCDPAGGLLYSWNLLSDGTVYTSFDAKSIPCTPWRARTGSIVIDLFDYGAGVAASCATAIAPRCGAVTTPSAVWTGWRIAQGEIDGLLWLPSVRGKCSYPDYDLVFLGALERRGYKVALGCRNDQVDLVAVAPTAEDLDTLWRVGLDAITPDALRSIVRRDSLQITTPIPSPIAG
jgi:hypothetical protein